MEAEGSLHISRSEGRIQYYLYENGKKKYIRAEDRELAKKICQKEYDRKVLQAAKKELQYLEKLEALYRGAGKECVCEDVYEKLSENRRSLVSPIRLPDQKFREQWEAMKYEKKSFAHDAPEYYTDKGERVRSKSEILLANLLRKHDIPYRYECPLVLSSGIVVHPDFTVLHLRLRKEIYLEHLGMMDDEQYCESALQRIRLYEKNGIFCGDRLLITHESSRLPLDVRIAEKMILQFCV